MPQGPPSTLTPKIQTKICRAIAAGASQETAARHAGVKYETLRSWLRRGKEGKTKALIAFVEEIEIANADCEVMCLSGIAAAGANDWKAYAWLLERKWPEKYGRRWQTVGTEFDKDEQGNPDFSQLSEEQVDAFIDQIAKAKAGFLPELSENGKPS